MQARSACAPLCTDTLTGVADLDMTPINRKKAHEEASELVGK